MGGLVSFAPIDTTEARAAPSTPGPAAPHATVLLLRSTHPSPAAAEALVRLRGELVAAGFAVQVADVPASSDGRAAVDRAAAQAHADAVIAILGDPARQPAELRVLDRATGKTFARQVPVPAESSRAAEILSIRALELLRASLLEAALAAGDPKPRAAAADPERGSGAATAPPETTKRSEGARAVESGARPLTTGRPGDTARPPATERRHEPPRPEATARAPEAPTPADNTAGPTSDEPSAEPRGRTPRDQPTPAPASPPPGREPAVARRHANAESSDADPPAVPFRYAVELGGVVLGSFEGLPPSVLPVIRGGVRLSPHFEVRLSLAGLGTRARVQTAGDTAEATVAQSFGLVELALAFRSGARVQPFVSLGAGAARVLVEGSAGWPYQGRSGALWAAVADAGVGVRVGLGRRFQLAVEAHAQGEYPYPVVRFLDTTLAEGGRPTVLGGLSLVTWL